MLDEKTVRKMSMTLYTDKKSVARLKYVGDLDNGLCSYIIEYTNGSEAELAVITKRLNMYLNTDGIHAISDEGERCNDFSHYMFSDIYDHNRINLKLIRT